MITYECWKCDKWHETDKDGALSALKEAIARPAIELGKIRLTIPNRLFWWWYRRKAG